jgi:hypothetical protein
VLRLEKGLAGISRAGMVNHRPGNANPFREENPSKSADKKGKPPGGNKITPLVQKTLRV